MKRSAFFSLREKVAGDSPPDEGGSEARYLYSTLLEESYGYTYD